MIKLCNKTVFTKTWYVSAQLGISSNHVEATTWYQLGIHDPGK